MNDAYAAALHFIHRKFTKYTRYVCVFFYTRCVLIINVEYTVNEQAHFLFCFVYNVILYFFSYSHMINDLTRFNEV